MQYKALMLDVDGTLVPYDYNAVPSDTIAEAIQKAQKHVTVCLVTGRSFAFLEEVMKKLQLREGFAVVNNGAQVFNIANQEILYDQPIEEKDAKHIIRFLHQEEVPFYIKQDSTDLAYQQGPFQKGEKLRKAYMFFSDEILSLEKADFVIDQLSHLPNIVLHKSRHKHPDKFGINISHAKATKLHGIHIAAKELGIETPEIIGVGDSYNDFPLLMASGLKVAMGNAIDDLKAIADYIAPTVDEDGVATVIEKFILKKN